MTRIRSLSTLLLATLGACTDGSAPLDAGATANVPYVHIGDAAPYRLRSLAVDSATYRELHDGGASGSALVDLGPSDSDTRVVRMYVDGSAPPALYTALLGPEEPLAQQAAEMEILLGDESMARIGLLLPAVQKVRGAALEADGTFMLELATPGDIRPSDEPVAAGGVSVAVGDVTGDGSGGASAPLGATIRLRIAQPATFSRTSTGLESKPIELVLPDSVPGWFDPARLDAMSLDLRDATGRIMHRVRIASPSATPSMPGSITLAPAKAIYLKIDGVDGESRDGAAEAELVRSYQPYSGRSYLVAADDLQPFPVTTLADLQLYWQNRAQIVDDLRAAIAHASEYEALACQVAMPDMLAAAQLAEVHAAALGDVSGVLATAFEAVHSMTAPRAKASATDDDVSRACAAVDGVASIRDALQEVTGTPNDAADRVLRVATIGRHARDLDRAVVEWIAMVDALAAGSVLDPVAAAAARAKADILIEALGNQADASSARWMLAVELAK